MREIEDPLAFIVLSRKRRNLLLLLRDGEKTLPEIRGSLGVTSSGIIPQLRKMEACNLIARNGKGYRLTSIGEVVAEHLSRLEKTLGTFKCDFKFWADHDITGIPEEFRLRLYELEGFRILRGSKANPLLPHREYIRNIKNSKWIKGVSPVFHDDYPEIFIQLLKEGANISIILTPEVLREIRVRNPKELIEALNTGRVKLFVYPGEIKVAFTVTDRFLSLGLFDKTGTYDFSTTLISFEDSARRFGESLFEYYRNFSTPFRLEEYVMGYSHEKLALPDAAMDDFTF